jgi:hypothetical protein
VVLHYLKAERRADALDAAVNGDEAVERQELEAVPPSPPRADNVSHGALRTSAPRLGVSPQSTTANPGSDGGLGSGPALSDFITL